MRSGSRHRGEAGGGWLFGFPPLLATDGRNHKGDCDMRTGAIFARGSCRALKWMALVGMVFALGAGSAAAQITVEVPPKVAEGATVPIAVNGTVPANETANADTVTVEISGVTSDSAATAPVTPGEPEDLGDFSDTLTINRPANGAAGTTVSVSGTLDWTVGRDPNNAEDEGVTVAIAVSSGGTLASGHDTHSVTIEDTDTQGYELNGATSITEGASTPTPLTLTAVPPLTVRLGGDAGVVSFGLEPNDPSKFVLTSTDTEFGGSVAGTATATIQALADGNRDEDTVTVTAYGGAPLMPLDDIEITVKDIHELPAAADITAVAYNAMADGDMVTSAEEGGEVYIEVMVDRGTSGYPSDEAIEVTLGLSDASLGTFDGTGKVEIAPGIGEQKATRVKLDIEEMDSFPQTGMLVVSLTASGKTAANGSRSVTGTPLSLTITDATVRQVFVLDDAMTNLYGARDAAKGSDGMLNPGDDFSVDNDMLFGSADGYTFQVDARSSMPAVVSVDDSSGDSISVMPQSVGGPAMITLTATALPETSSFRDTQVSESVATIEFEVTVEAVPTAAPDTPAAPTVAAPKAQGTLDVSWTAPAANGSPITGYGLRYKMSSAADWTVMSASVTGTSTTLTGLSAGTSYDVQVNATNADGTSGWSKSGTGSTAAAPVNAAPDAPAAPTVTTAEGQGSLDVSWKAPADNGSAIIDYGLQYRVQGSTNWTVMSAAVTGTSTTLSGMPAGTTYEVQVRARNANGSSDWSKSGMGSTAAAPVAPVRRGQLTAFELIGSDVSEKTIAGTKRYHVPEGAQNVQLSVTVQWTHEEIAAIGYDTAQRVDVSIRSGRDTTGNSPAGAANWLSWIDDGGDVHFAQYAAWDAGHGYSTAAIEVKTPRASEIPAAQRGSARHVKSKEGKIDVLVLHDNHEAENDAFYIEAFDSQYSNVDLAATKAVNKITPEVVIEDDEAQSVTVKMGTKTSSTVYEGDSGDDVPEFTVAADPRRYDLPLEVRLDMVDLGGTTVSAGEISVSTGSLTLNDGNTSNSGTVTVHLPASDGNRVDDDYELQASVNVYSVSSGGYRTIEAASHPIKVLDRHKLPEVKVSPKTGTVEEGGAIELTVTINRNPSNTTVSNAEKLQYTQEEVSVMLDMGAGSTAGASDFSVMTNPVVFPKRERGAYTAEKTVEVMAKADDELDDMEMLVLDAMVAGSVAANGSEKESTPGVSTLTIEEGTAKLVWAKAPEEVEAAVYAAKNAGMGDDMMLTPDEMIEVIGRGLFNAAEGVTVSYSAMTSDRDVASTSVDNAGMVMVTAMGAGMADITITAHASMPSGVKIGVSSNECG